VRLNENKDVAKQSIVSVDVDMTHQGPLTWPTQFYLH